MKHLKGKRQPAKESTTVEKGKDAYSRLKHAFVEEGGVDGDEVADELEPGVPITSPCDSVMLSDL